MVFNLFWSLGTDETLCKTFSSLCKTKWFSKPKFCGCKIQEISMSYSAQNGIMITGEEENCDENDKNIRAWDRRQSHLNCVW